MTTTPDPHDENAQNAGAHNDDDLRQAPAAAVTPEAIPASSGANDAPSRVRRMLTPVLALVAVAVVALFGGILIGQNTAPASQAASFNRPGAGGPSQQGAGAAGGGQGQGVRQGGPGGVTAGTIVSISGDTITLKDRAGATITVTTTDSTTVSTTSKSSVSKLKAGETITVRGTTGTDGNVAATSVAEGKQAFGSRPGTGTGNSDPAGPGTGGADPANPANPGSNG